MRTLLFVLFALVVSCSALAAAPEAEASTRSAINLAQSAPAAAPAGAAAPAKPFYDPLLMYNPYMCATPAAPAARTLASMHRPARELAPGYLARCAVLVVADGWLRTQRHRSLPGH